LVESFGLVKRYPVGDDFVHVISEREFQLFFKAALELDQEYFLTGCESEWQEYYLRNKFDLYHNRIDQSLLEKIGKHTGYLLK
jgi:hypothetical protein